MKKIKNLFIKIGHFFKNIFVKIGHFFKFIGQKIWKVIRKPTLKVWKVMKVPFSFINSKFKKLPNKKKNAIQGYLYILPWIIGFSIFGVYQMFSSLRMSFAESAQTVIDQAKGKAVFQIRGFSFVQYQDIFKNNPTHLDTILATLSDVAIVIPLVVIFALILALLLKRPIKGKGLFRTIFFVPVILLSGNLLSYFNQYGLLVMPAVASGKIQEAISFYFPAAIADIISFAFGKIILILWLSGVQTIIFLAGLNKIDKSVYEAASIEGANGWDCFWKITLPSISGLIVINIIYTTVIYCNLSNNGLVALINDVMLNPIYGRDYASALSWILFTIELLVIGVYSLVITLIFRRNKRGA